MSQASITRAISRIGPLQIVIIILAVVTALIHLNLGLMTSGLLHGTMPNPRPKATGPRPGSASMMDFLPVPLPILFFLNFLGYSALIAVLYMPVLRNYQRILRWILMAFTAITIIAWFAITHGHANVLAYVDKPIELALIVLLFIDDRRASALA